jgi:hypothetical protein
VKRIFLTLAVLANITMLIALILGVQIGDPMQNGGRDPAVNSRIGTHILIGLGALTSTTMVHALIFTYFMGTGRWLEETSTAYALADPATAVSLEATVGISDSTLHFAMAVLTWIVTMMINFTQYIAIARNSAVVEGVLAEVRRIRLERGLPVD